MAIEKIFEGFDKLFLSGLGDAINGESRREFYEVFRAGCIRLLREAYDSNRVGPDLIPDEIGYCKVLVAAGLLDEFGDKNSSIYYIPSDETRDLVENSR
ncbi:MAG: hypothetical protein AABW89_00215 [Nanoarchaeota archaeon]